MVWFIIGTILCSVAVALFFHTYISPEAYELIVKEIKKIKAEKLTDEEIERSKIQLKGNYILSNESVGARMQALGRAALLNRPIKTPEETIEKIMAVTNSDVSEIIDRVLDISTLSVAAVGPIKGTEELFLF